MVATLGPPTIGEFALAPDDIRIAAKFLVNTIVGDSDNAPLEVTLNWMAGLKK